MRLDAEIKAGVQSTALPPATPIRIKRCIKRYVALQLLRQLESLRRTA
jgi:hypothetical protein